MQIQNGQICFGDIGSISLDESMLWFWRYETEMIHRLGKEKKAYLLCLYEELTDSPVKIAKEVYHHLGLEWNQIVENNVYRSSQRSKKIEAKWRTSLSNTEINNIEKVLIGSPMQDWWEDKT